MTEKPELRNQLKSLIDSYGAQNVVNYLNTMLFPEDFYTAHVLHNLVRSSRKNALQLVALVGNESQDWCELPTFKLSQSEKQGLSGRVKKFTYEQALPGFFDPAVVD